MCLLSGECLALKYRWSNQEYKILPIWSNQYLIDSNPYWFDYYPFLKRTNNHINSNFQQYHLLTSSTTTNSNFTSTHPALFLSHNDHFGHFLVDDFPLLYLFSGPLRNLIPSFSFASIINHKSSILELFSSSVGLEPSSVLFPDSKQAPTYFSHR